MSKESNYLNNQYQSFFENSLSKIDPDIHKAINDELHRQQNHIELIASENIVSQAVLEAQGSVLTNKYAEGYSGKRYYNGCEHVDVAENLANERLKKLFDCNFANSQPHSGAQANGAVFLALLKPGDTFMGMSLNSGGHITHGLKIAMSGKWFNAIGYDVDEKSELIDYDKVEKIALENKPKLIIAGGSAYSRVIDFKRFREIADKVGAYLMVDMAHFSGLVAGKGYPNPVKFAHVVTSTTHKVFRSARGGIILTNDEGLSKKINSAVFPGYQGGPLMHIIAAKAVAFKEASTPQFRKYQQNTLSNARCLASELSNNGLRVVSGGTQNHIVLVDLTSENVTGKEMEIALGKAAITVNKNTVPGEKRSPFVTSGIRLGTPAVTSRGMGAEQMREIAKLISLVLKNISDDASLHSLASKTKDLVKCFPLYEEWK